MKSRQTTWPASTSSKVKSLVASPQLRVEETHCIDCDARVEACPVGAVFAEDQLPDEWQHFTEFNAAFYSRQT